MNMCGSCWFFVPVQTMENAKAAHDNKDVQGQCYGMPPTPVPVQVPKQSKIAINTKPEMELSVMSLTVPVTSTRRACNLWSDIEPFEIIEGDEPLQ